MRTLLILAALVFVLVLATVGLVGPDAGDAQSQPDRHAAVARRDLPQLVGMTINLYHVDDVEAALEGVRRIASMGFNALQIVTPAFQVDGSDSLVQRIVGPGRGPSDEQLLDVLLAARKAGLHTALLPQVNFTEPRGNEWRGKIQPDDWSAWWQSYQQVIEQFASIAQQAEVDVFAIGCELLTTERPDFADRWLRVIEAVERRYDGRLTYSTNWDHFTHPPFWSQLDYIGISGYWDLTRGSSDRESPTSDDLARRWREIQQQILAFAESQDMPALITELGYPSLPWALREPWNYVVPSTAEVAPDPAAQARGYRSFVDAWSGLIVPPSQQDQQPGDERLAGVLFYKWDLWPDASGDRGYGIDGKPAEDLLRQWLRTTAPAAE